MGVLNLTGLFMSTCIQKTDSLYMPGKRVQIPDFSILHVLPWVFDMATTNDAFNGVSLNKESIVKNRKKKAEEIAQFKARRAIEDYKLAKELNIDVRVIQKM